MSRSISAFGHMLHRIDWRRERRRVLLPAVILRPYPVTDLGGVDATALIDTGSSVSGVGISLAQTLGLVGLGKRPLKSAQGEGHVERYAFRIGLRSNSTSGMDILSQCDFVCNRSGDCSLSFG